MSILSPNSITVNELALSHAILDRCGVPRRLRGAGLTLPQRISYLRGRLFTASELSCASRSSCSVGMNGNLAYLKNTKQSR
jgi:hypothetical protein